MARARAIAEKVKVRLAVQADEPALYDLLVELWGHNNFGWGYDFDPATVVRAMEQGTRPEPATRSDPSDQVRAVIGVVDGEGGLTATVALVISPIMWFSTDHALQERWLYVRQACRGQGWEQALRDFTLQTHAALNTGVDQPLVLYSGFYHDSPRFRAMSRLWSRLWPRARMVGALFRIE